MGIFDSLFGSKNNFPPSETNRRNSLRRMASNLSCTADRVKQKFLIDLISKNLSSADIVETVIILRNNKIKEAQEFSINPEDTCTSYMERWTQEFVDKYIQPYSSGVNKTVKEQLVASDQQFAKIIYSGNNSQIERYLDKYPEIQERLMEDLVARTPYERYSYRSRLMRDKNDYIGRLFYLNQAIHHTTDISEKVFIATDKAECFEKLYEYEYAISSLDMAIELEKQKVPIDYLDISMWYKNKAYIRRKVGDENGELLENQLAEEFRMMDEE